MLETKPFAAPVVDTSPAAPRCWAALHRADGTELTPETAPGYQRVPYTEDWGARWGKIPADWGWVVFMSAWDAREGGNIVSDPPLQHVTL